MFLFIITFFTIFNLISPKQSFGLDNLRILSMQLSLILFPTFAMWILAINLLQEKLGNEKLLGTLGVMLTAPISLTELWVSKIVAIFLMSYPVLILINIITNLIWLLNGFNPITLDLGIWVLVFFILPMYVMALVSLCSWAIMRFSNPKVGEILIFITVGIITLVFLNFSGIGNIINNGFISLKILCYLFLGLVLVYSIIYILIRNLDKEFII